jgi:gliding motility-associated-like protein
MAEKEVVVYDLPIITITPSSPSVELGESIELKAEGADTYEWTPSTYLDNPNSATPVSTPDSTILYTVTGADANGCIGTSEVTVIVTKGPPEVNPEIVFTPNGDGINDEWYIEGLDEFPENIVSVFTRTGKRVYEKNNYTQDWDGRYEGRELEEGVYYYVIVYEGQTLKSGAVTIVR